MIATTRLPIEPDEYGLVERLLKHERAQGGTLAEMSGIQGCGKTTLLLGIAATLGEAGEKLVWRGRSIDAWDAFPGPVKVHAEYPVAFVQIAHDTGEKAPLDIPVHRFSGPAEILEHLEPGVLNVVYAREHEEDEDHDNGLPHKRLKTRFWDRLVYAAVHRVDVDWHAFFIDEIHEVWGDRPEGEDWHAQRAVRETLADFRKAFCSLFGATHHYDECDEAILKKFQFHVYLRGARIPSWSVIRNRSLAHQLGRGQCIIESGNFAKVAFPNIERPPSQLMAVPLASWMSEPGGGGVNRVNAHARTPARAGGATSSGGGP